MHFLVNVMQRRESPEYVRRDQKREARRNEFVVMRGGERETGQDETNKGKH